MIPGVKRPCLDCGVLTDKGSRCPTHQSALMRRVDAARKPRPHYAGDYDRRAREVRESTVVCAICGEGPRPADPWQADHVREGGDPTSPLQGVHRSCNIRKSHAARRAARSS